MLLPTTYCRLEMGMRNEKSVRGRQDSREHVIAECNEAIHILDGLNGNVKIREHCLGKRKPGIALAHPVAIAQVPRK